MIGQVINNFEIVRQVGHGGMGAVYEARDRMLDRRVAIKVVRPELGADRELRQRFQQEAQALARLHHPNITSVFSFFNVGEQLYLVMELVEGEPLQRRLRQRGAIPWQEAVALAISALDGLAHAHANGIVHRDVKPSNLMLVAGGGLKLMDFGISHVLGQSRLTRQGSVVGTLAYMAPEQITRREVDPRTDLYAIGVVLYEMVTGRTPFRADSDYELMRAQVEITPDPPRALVPGLPAWLELRIIRALAKNPDDRPQSAAELAAELRRGLEQDATLESAPTQRLVAPALLAASVGAGLDDALPTQTATRLSHDRAPSSEGDTLPPLPDVMAPLPGLSRRKRRGAVVAAFVVTALLLMAVIGLALSKGWLKSGAPEQTPGSDPSASAETALVDPRSGPATGPASPTERVSDPPSDATSLGAASAGTAAKVSQQVQPQTTAAPPPAPPASSPERLDDGTLRASKGPRIDPSSPRAEAQIGGAPPPTYQPAPPKGRPSAEADPDQLLLDAGTIARQLPDSLEEFCQIWEDRLDQAEDDGTRLTKADRLLGDQVDLLLDASYNLRHAFNVVASREGLIDSSGMLGRLRRLGSATREGFWQQADEAIAEGRRASELLSHATATTQALRQAWSPIQADLYQLEQLSQQAGPR